ncbi:hypothetical protein D3C87_283270 [compost metagenome]
MDENFVSSAVYVFKCYAYHACLAFTKIIFKRFVHFLDFLIIDSLHFFERRSHNLL